MWFFTIFSIVLRDSANKSFTYTMSEMSIAMATAQRQNRVKMASIFLICVFLCRARLAGDSLPKDASTSPS